VGSDLAEQALRSNATARAISDAEKRVSAFRRERKIGKGTLRATHLSAFRGFVGDRQAHVRVRVLEEPVIPDAAELLTDPAILRSNLRRFVPLAFPGVTLHLMFRDARVQSVSDRHGYATAHIPTGRIKPGWHEFHCVTEPDDLDELPTIANGEFLVPDPKAPFAVISDIDDTVLRTGLTEGFVAVRNTLLQTTNTRRAVPGMASLYATIARGKDSLPEPAFFYLSTGPWNLYTMLTEFLETRAFPKGVLFLTDWGPQERYVMRSGREHKRLTLNRIFGIYPRTHFVLIGDSGQNDPLVYTEIAKSHPKRIAAIIILDVGDHMADRAEELKTMQTDLLAEGLPFYFVEDAADAARVMTELNLLDDDAYSEVAAALLREKHA